MNKVATTFFSLMSGKRLHRTHWTELPMPAEVKDRVHALARRAHVTRGLTFTDSHGNDLDALYPAADDDDDSDYDPDTDENASLASSDVSDSVSNAASTSSDSHDANLTNDDPGETPGVDGANLTNDDPGETPGVDGAIPGVDARTTGVDGINEPDGTNEPEDDVDLETYVNALETELDDEIADLDSDYGSESPESDIELDNRTHSIKANEIDKLNSDAAREQTSANQDADGHDDTDDESTDDDDDVPLPRLRRKRAPSYKHLKGRDGDESLPTVARPREFRGDKHQAHVILQNIVMTQYNLKQGIKKFGDVGKAAVLVELRQLYDPKVMSPINKYDLTAAESKGALRYLRL
jgi:hypothetical protein